MNINIRAEKCCGQLRPLQPQQFLHHCVTTRVCRRYWNRAQCWYKESVCIVPNRYDTNPCNKCSNQLKNILHNIRKSCGISFTAAGQFISDSILGEVVLVAGQGFYQLGNSLRLNACSTGHVSSLNMPTLIQGLRGIPQSHESQTTTSVPCQEGPPSFAFHFNSIIGAEPWTNWHHSAHSSDFQYLPYSPNTSHLHVGFQND